MLPESPSQFLTNGANKEFSIPPLDTERFEGSYGHFCTAKRLVLDRELLYAGGRKVSLHSLHEEVMKQQGYDIHEKGPEFWLKIGTRLGFIQSQDTVSASSEIADRLATIYKQYLGEFDTIYVMSFIQELKQRMADSESTG